MQLIDAALLPESRGAITALIEAFRCCLWSLDATGGTGVSRRLRGLARLSDGAWTVLARLALGHGDTGSGSLAPATPAAVASGTKLAKQHSTTIPAPARRARPCIRTLRTASDGVGFWRYAGL
jgi:hypothetical protein